MNELIVFQNEDFGALRTLAINERPYFVASDVAKALGYKKPRNAVATHCRWALKWGIPHPQSETKTLEVVCIPEGDLYRLTANSELPSAEPFEAWIFDEVLPSIRKHGAYMTPDTLEEAILNPDAMIRVLTELKEERALKQKAQQQIEADKPKVLFADAVSASNTDILVGDLAKFLKQNGIDTGKVRLFQWLRDNGYLIKRKGDEWNTPTQRSMDMGLFHVKETAIHHSDGHISTRKTSKVTGKGQQYFIDKFLN